MNFKACSFLASILYFVVEILSVDGKTFLGDRSTSFATYSIWNATLTGTLTFRFRSYQHTAMLVYVDDQERMRGNGNFIKLTLLDGALELHMQVSDLIEGSIYEAETQAKRVRVGNHLNDGEYHLVELDRVRLVTKLAVDGRAAHILTSIILPNINSPVHVGGFSVGTTGLVDKSAQDVPRFIGCLEELRYDSGMDLYLNPLPFARLVEEAGTKEGCFDACGERTTQKCFHGGLCLNKFSSTACDCRGTGFQGPNCTLPSPVLQFLGLDYLSWQPGHPLFDQTSQISIRFKTDRSSGILLYISDQPSGSYILIEIYEAVLYLHIKLVATFAETYPVDSGLSLNDNRWHFVYAIRRRLHLTIQIDRSFSISKHVRELHDGRSVPNRGSLPASSVVVGGLGVPSSLEMSLGKRGFTGCLQDVNVNQFNLIEILKSEVDSSVRVYGNVKDGCLGRYTMTRQSDIELLINTRWLNEKDAGNQSYRQKTSINLQNFGNESFEPNRASKGDVIGVTLLGICVTVIVISIVVCATRYSMAKRLRNRELLHRHAKMAGHLRYDPNSSFVRNEISTKEQATTLAQKKSDRHCLTPASRAVCKSNSPDLFSSSLQMHRL